MEHNYYMLFFSLGVFTVRFGSVFIKKSNQTEFFFIKKTETEPRPVQTDRFRFGSVRFFREKTGSNRFSSVFPVLLSFFGLGSVRFVFLLIKLNRPVFSKF